MTAPLATDAEIAAAIKRTARPATMVKLDCGDIRILPGIHKVGQNVECVEDECEQGARYGAVTIVDTFETAIV